MPPGSVLRNAISRPLVALVVQGAKHVTMGTQGFAFGAGESLLITADVPTLEKADRSDPSHVAAPFSGVVTLVVGEGDSVEAGATIATIEAMKMEAAITAPRAGTVTRVAISGVTQVEGGDLIAVVAVGDRADV